MSYYSIGRCVYTSEGNLLSVANSKADANVIVDALNMVIKVFPWPTDTLIAATVDGKRVLWLKDRGGDYSSSTYTAVAGVDTMEDVVACMAVPRVEWEAWKSAAAYRKSGEVAAAEFETATYNLYHAANQLDRSFERTSDNA